MATSQRRAGRRERLEHAGRRACVARPAGEVLPRPGEPAARAREVAGVRGAARLGGQDRPGRAARDEPQRAALAHEVERRGGLARREREAHADPEAGRGIAVAEELQAGEGDVEEQIGSDPRVAQRALQNAERQRQAAQERCARGSDGARGEERLDVAGGLARGDHCHDERLHEARSLVSVLGGLSPGPDRGEHLGERAELGRVARASRSGPGERRGEREAPLAGEEERRVVQRRARAVAQRLRLRLGARRAADHRGGGDEGRVPLRGGRDLARDRGGVGVLPGGEQRGEERAVVRSRARVEAERRVLRQGGAEVRPRPEADAGAVAGQELRERGAAARVARIELRRAPVRGERAGTVEPVTEPPPHSVVLEDPPQHPMPPRAPGLEVDRAARLRRRALAVPELEEREREVERVHRRARVRRREPAQLRERLPHLAAREERRGGPLERDPVRLSGLGGAHARREGVGVRGGEPPAAGVEHVARRDRAVLLGGVAARERRGAEALHAVARQPPRAEAVGREHAVADLPCDRGARAPRPRGASRAPRPRARPRGTREAARAPARRRPARAPRRRRSPRARSFLPRRGRRGARTGRRGHAPRRPGTRRRGAPPERTARPGARGGPRGSARGTRARSRRGRLSARASRRPGPGRARRGAARAR